jgi:pimeloyl-ACP methyl ester carboxylesterase
MVNASVLRSLYPFQSHYLSLEKQRMHYLDEGQGEVLLALHGNPTWSFYFRNLVVSLRSKYRWIVPDHIGCGFSDKPDDSLYSYRLEQRVKDIEALVRKLQLKDITLVLHDWGGMIGLAFAARNPQLVRRIVLMNTAGFPLPQSKPFPLALALSRSSWLGALLVRGCNAFALAAAYIGAKRQTLPPALRRAYLSPYDSWEHRRAVHRFVQDIPLRPGDSSWSLVESVSCQLESLGQKPIQIIWGERDFVFDRHFLAEWRRRLPQAEIHSYPDAGHYILEDLGDEAVQLIEDFLRRHPLAP